MRRILGVLLITLTMASGGWAQTKKRVAVMDFDFGAVQNNVSAIFGANQDVGKGIADLMVTQVGEGSGVLGDRAQGHRQNPYGAEFFQQRPRQPRHGGEDRADSGFGRDHHRQHHAVRPGRPESQRGGRRRWWNRRQVWHGWACGTHKAKAVVVISARMVDTTTAEILAAVDGKGESTRSGTSLLGGGGSSSGGWRRRRMTWGARTLAPPSWARRPAQAVADCSKQLEDAAGKLPTKVITVSGLVADVTG